MQPRIMFYTDARHSHIYRYEPPMTREEYAAVIDELVGTPIEAVMVCLGEGRTMLHDTKAGELLGRSIEKWDHLVFRRAHQNAKALIEAGNDPLRIICERAHERGLLLYPMLQVQKQGPESVPDRCSDFRRDNTHLEIGAAGDLGPDFHGFDLLDFKHLEVRKERFGIIEEVLNDYAVDGFELNLEEAPCFFHPEEVEAGRQILTDWVGQIREEVKRTGKDRELVIQIPLDLELCHAAGMNVEDWIRDELVDVLVAKDETNGPMTDFGRLLALTSGTKTRVHAPLDNNVNTDRIKFASASAARAAACNYWAQGVGGLYLTRWHGEWPFEDAFYAKLREMAYPEIMAPKDKLYLVPSSDKADDPLPLELGENRPISISLMVSDDLRRWAESGRLYEVLLRIRLISHTELDRISFKLNGSELPEGEHRRINEIYKIRSTHQRIMFGYWHVFRLGPESWPELGWNIVEVTLLSRDPDVVDSQPLRLHDVELETRYLLGKNFHRGDGEFGDVDPDLGPHD